MYFESFHAALTMAGHGAYVWTACLVSIGVIAVVILAPLRRRRRFLRQLAAEQQRVRGAADGRASEAL